MDTVLALINGYFCSLCEKGNTYHMVYGQRNLRREKTEPIPGVILMLAYM